jgi:hypothetical protein
MKPAFKLPDRKVDDWVTAGGGEGTPPSAAPAERSVEHATPQPKLKPARLTVDLEPRLHARFKAACALNSTDMVTEVRHFIETWTAEHSQ